MRGLRSFLGLLAILVALGAYLYFVDSKREPGDADKREKVFNVPSDAIEEITVKAESGEQTSLKKSGSDWQIVQPAELQPDSAEVSGLASNLSNLEVQRVIDDKPGGSRRVRPRDASRRDRVQGQGPGPQAPPRPEVADGNRPLCESRRSAARVPDFLLPRLELQQEDLRSA